MKIERIEIHLIRVPFDMGAAPKAFAGMNWTSVDSLFVRVCTDTGVEGWGESWGHVACPTTSAALSSLVGPAFIGRDISHRSSLMAEMAHRFHIHGRSGPVVYALSAIEIAFLARAHGVDYVPHCFYFGPGFLASLHLAAAYAPEVAFELFFGDLEASPYHDAVRARDGHLTVPAGPGLGIEPDIAVIDRYRLGMPVVIGR